MPARQPRECRPRCNPRIVITTPPPDTPAGPNCTFHRGDPRLADEPQRYRGINRLGSRTVQPRRLRPLSPHSYDIEEYSAPTCSCNGCNRERARRRNRRVEAHSRGYFPFIPQDIADGGFGSPPRVARSTPPYYNNPHFPQLPPPMVPKQVGFQSQEVYDNSFDDLGDFSSTREPTLLRQGGCDQILDYHNSGMPALMEPTLSRQGGCDQILDYHTAGMPASMEPTLPRQGAWDQIHDYHTVGMPASMDPILSRQGECDQILDYDTDCMPASMAPPALFTRRKKYENFDDLFRC